jgi:hypothetical protein
LAEQHRATGLPSDDVLEAELKTYRDFNPNAVTGFVKDFKDTLEFSGLLEKGVLKLDGMITNQAKEEGQKAQPFDTSLIKDFFAPSEAKSTPVSVRRYPMDISIPRNVKAELAISGQELRKEDLERLKKQIDRLIENLSEAFED